MKIRPAEFQKHRRPIPLYDKPYPSTKITFASFENHLSKCFKEFHNPFDVTLSRSTA